MQHILTHNYIKWLISPVWTQCTKLDLNVPNDLYINPKCAIEFTKEINESTYFMIKTGSKEQNTVARILTNTHQNKGKSQFGETPSYCK